MARRPHRQGRRGAGGGDRVGGEPRPFLLRPVTGPRPAPGTATRFLLGRGDLLVTGGACQRRWQHAVPKVASAGPRISITFRHGLDPRAYPASPAAGGGSPGRA